LQTIDAVTLFSVIGLAFSVGLAIRYGHLSADHSHLTKQQRTSRLLTTLFGWYTIATFITVGGYFFVDIGKLWVPTGALHNLVEVAILLTLLFEGHVQNFRYFYSLLFNYVLLAVFITLILPWPIDALFFKLQGLIIDFALVIQFSRLYNVNKKAEYLTPGPRRGETAGLLSNNELEPGNGVVEEDVVPDEHRSETQNIRILIYASVIHLIGNIIATLFVDTFWPFFFFQFTYGVTFPLYGFYVFRQPAVPKQLAYYKSTWTSEILVGLLSTFLSFLTVALAAIWTFGHQR